MGVSLIRKCTTAALLLSPLLACEPTEILQRQCPTSCYAGPAGTEGLGQCTAGKPLCDDEGNLIECVGQVLPGDEVCDGVDNDCDGFVDGMIQEVSLVDLPDDYPCIVFGECSQARLVCTEGEWTCDYPETVELEGETRCDGLDNDCDGQVDEDLFDNEFCYTGDPGSATNAPCHPGVLKCLQGEVVCANQVLPTPELCDNVDNNCDGVMDNPETENAYYDIVLAIDSSPSMMDYIQAVLGALGRYVETLDGSSARFAIIDISGTNAHGGSAVKIVQNFSGLSQVHNALQYMAPSGHADEASLDAIGMVCESVGGERDSLGLDWRDGSTVIYLGFTDEPPQSYRSPAMTQGSVADLCWDEGVLVYQWSAYDNEFEHITNTTGGVNFSLSDNENNIFSELNTVISSFCAEPE